jgi:hypothetical protein
MTRLVLITLFSCRLPRQRRGRSSITRSFVTIASVTVPSPATPVTNEPTIPRRRRFPGHKRCTDCHRGQFTTPQVPMCVICHN